MFFYAKTKSFCTSLEIPLFAIYAILEPTGIPTVEQSVHSVQKGCIMITERAPSPWTLLQSLLCRLAKSFLQILGCCAYVMYSKSLQRVFSPVLWSPEMTLRLLDAYCTYPNCTLNVVPARDCLHV